MVRIDYFDKHHIMRRLLLVAFTSILLMITYKIFCTDVKMDVFKVSVYVSFSGLMGFMLKFYFDSRDIEIKGKIAEDKRENVADIKNEEIK